MPARQPRRGRLWLNDGSCVRLRPQGPSCPPCRFLPLSICRSRWYNYGEQVIVTLTQSLGSGFGSGIAIGSTGIFLNNVSNWFDLVLPRIESGYSKQEVFWNGVTRQPTCSRTVTSSEASEHREVMGLRSSPHEDTI